VRSTDTLIEDLNTNATTFAIEEAFNVDLEFIEYPSADAQAKLSVVMASSGKLPDIINFGLDYVTENNYATRGLLLPLNEYFENPEMTKNLDSRLDAEAKAQLLNAVKMPDGNIYGLPTYDNAIWGAAPYRVWLNKEWLDNLGLDVPTTTEDFRDVMAAFMTDDPNGNGLNDEVGMLGFPNGYGSDVTTFLLNSFIYADPAMNYFGVENGEIYAAFVKDEFRDGLEYIHGLVEEGLIYEGSFTQDQTQMRAIINQEGDYAVSAVAAGSAGHWSGVSANPNLPKMMQLEPLTGPEGVSFTPTNEASMYNCWYITKDCEYPELAFAIGEHFYDLETSLTQRYGIKEQDWTTDPVKMDNYLFEYEAFGYDRIFAVMRDAAWTEINNVNWRSSTPKIFGRDLDMSWAIETKENVANGVTIVFRPDHYERYAHHMAEEIIGKLNYTVEEAEVISDIAATINAYVKEAITAFVTGNRDLAEWDSFVAEVNEMGLETYISTMQSAYDRKVG